MQLYKKFTNLDLSSNRLTGTLMDTYQSPSNSIDMSVNRISGRVPVILRSTNATVDVLTGNLFGCPFLSNDVTSSGKNDLTCGSQIFDSSIITWLGVAVSVAIIIVLSLLMCNTTSTFVRMVNIVLVWMKASHSYLPLSSTSSGDDLSNSLLHTIRAVTLLEVVSSMSLILVVILVLVVMMTYIGLKLTGSTHINSVYQEQYLYTVTAAFFTGVRPAVAIWIFVVLSGALVGILCVRSRPLVTSSKYSAERISDSKSNATVYQEYQDSLKTFLLQFTVSILIIGAALAVNVGYVEIVYFGKQSSLSAVQFAFAVIKCIFSSVIVPFSSKLIRREYRSVYSMAMKIIVSTAAPAVAILLTSPLCLLYQLRPKPITDNYMTGAPSCYLGDNLSCYVVPVPASTLFIPPWSYSYQCSSSFLESYLPNFVYMYTVNGIIVPLISITLLTYLSKGFSFPLLEYFPEISSVGDKSPFTSIFTISDNYKVITSSSQLESQVEMSLRSKTVTRSDTSEGSSANTTTKNANNTNISTASKKYDFEMSDLVPGICVDITLLLTFGIASPLLAIPISFNIIINALLLRLALGRYIIIVGSDIGHAACYQKLEGAFEDIWKGLPGIIIIIIFTIISTIIIITIIMIRFVGNNESIRRHVLGTIFK